jgi:hypothetical protein
MRKGTFVLMLILQKFGSGRKPLAKKVNVTSAVFVDGSVRRYTCVLTSMSQRVGSSNSGKVEKVAPGFLLAGPLVKIKANQRHTKKI